MGSLKLCVLAATACLFWTTVGLVQRPWRTLAHRLASGNAPAQAEAPRPFPDDERSRASADLMTYLTEIQTIIGPERPRAIAPWERGLRWRKRVKSAKGGWRHGCAR